jgi:hypothetical protein
VRPRNDEKLRFSVNRAPMGQGVGIALSAEDKTIKQDNNFNQSNQKEILKRNLKLDGKLNLNLNQSKEKQK